MPGRGHTQRPWLHQYTHFQYFSSPEPQVPPLPFPTFSSQLFETSHTFSQVTHPATKKTRRCCDPFLAPSLLFLCHDYLKEHQGLWCNDPLSSGLEHFYQSILWEVHNRFCSYLTPIPPPLFPRSTPHLHTLLCLSLSFKIIHQDQFALPAY